VRHGVQKRGPQLVGLAEDLGLGRFALEPDAFECEGELVGDGGKQAVIRGAECGGTGPADEHHRADTLAFESHADAADSIASGGRAGRGSGGRDDFDPATGRAALGARRGPAAAEDHLREDGHGLRESDRFAVADVGLRSYRALFSEHHQDGGEAQLCSQSFSDSCESALEFGRRRHQAHNVVEDGGFFLAALGFSRPIT
jgi:hypothetical protein